MSEQTSFIGRQPIFDRDKKVYAYELLFRDSHENRARITDADDACRRTMINALMEIGLERLIGEHLAFINMTRTVLLDSSTRALPKERTVVEILEDVSADPELLEGVKALRAQGYTIALDDFELRADLAPLVRLADIVKLDVRAQGLEGMQKQVDALRPFGVKLLAEKVETAEEFEATKAMGCAYFQGHWLSKPVVITGGTVQPMATSSIRLLALLQRPDSTQSEIEALINKDAALSYKLLRYLNSSFFSLPRQIDSVRRALALLGTSTVRRWASLLVLMGGSNTAPELIWSATLRGTMCQELARASGVKESDPYFTAGLFSMLDVITGRPLKEILAELPLVPEISAALLDGSGAVGEALSCVQAYERGDFDRARFRRLSEAQILAAYLLGVDASQALRGL